MGENNRPHHHIIISCKNILGYNTEFIYNIRDYFRKNLNEWDVIVDILLNFKEYKNRFNYLFKENAELNIIFFNSKLYNLYNDDLSIYNLNIIFIFSNLNFPETGSCSKINSEYDEYTIINIINFFFSYKYIYIYKDILYEKIENTILSYKKLFLITDLTNYLINIFEELLFVFEIQMKNIDLYMLKIKYFYKIEQLIERTNQFIINKIIIKFDLIEFKDGVYSLSKDKFLKKDLLINYNIKNVGTLKYYNKTYKNLKLPLEWKNLIEETLDNKEDAIKLFEYFATLFNKNDDLLGKKRIIYIKGKPSTGKTTLLTKIIYSFFGEENIGTVSGNSNFSLESLLQKELAVLDEAEHLKLNAGFLLKITELNNPQTIDRKYKKAAILKSLKIIFLSNNEIKLKKNIVQDAFNKRIQMFEFNKQLPDEIKLYKAIIDMIIKEEINIIIYCNKLFFKKYVYKNKPKPKIRCNKTFITLLLN